MLGHISSDSWYTILVDCGVSNEAATKWSYVFANTIKETTFSKGKEEIDDFLGQVLHESAHLTRLSENLNYKTAKRLTEVWPHRFPTLDSAKPYVNNPEGLANLVYGGRMGNYRPGDGWLYRGRSPIQITGRDNYLRMGKILGQDLDSMPDLLEQPHFALEATIAWWEDRVPDSMVGDIEKVTKRVNGCLIGLTDREHLTAEAREALDALMS